MGSIMVEVNDLSFRYDQRESRPALTNITFNVQRGEWLAITGHNGSGKSTLAQLLVGLRMPDEGNIRIAGMNLTERNKRLVRRQIGIVFQNPDNQIVGSSVQDDVAFALENNNIPYQDMKIAVDKALAIVGLTASRHHDPARLSGGQKQRVALAGVLAFQPSVLVLDEALVMLDPKSREDILALLKESIDQRQITILSITHDMNEAAMADRVLVLHEGTIVQQCTPHELFKNEQGLEVPFTEQ